jgi:mycoredoxin-dependent peroxiredoxin
LKRRVFLSAAASLAGLSAADGPADLERVAVGTTAPDFDLPNGEGKPLRLSSLRGQRVVVVFYRGQW